MAKNQKKQKTCYLLFCNHCGAPKEIPIFILRTYLVSEKAGVYCDNCQGVTRPPDYVRKLSEDF
jgi:hypothetical protein